MEYVVGFCIDLAQGQVLLVKKNRPEFQKGKWNGIGGKIEPGEQPIDAMVREFREEAGIQTAPIDWIHTITLTGNNDQADSGKPFRVYYYKMGRIYPPHESQMTDEVVSYKSYMRGLWDLPTLPNLRWIFPLQLSENVRFPIEVDWTR